MLETQQQIVRHLWTVFLLLPAAGIAAMIVFMLVRRARRGRWLRQRDELRREWSALLPALMAGGSVPREKLADRDGRETLERLVLDRLAVAEPDDAARLRRLLEREGFFDRHLDWLRRGGHWQKLDSAALLGRTHAVIAVPELITLLKHHLSPEVRSAAARALAEIGEPRAGPELIELARAGPLPVEPLTWLRVVASCRVPAALLVGLLSEDRAELRALAARALAELPDPAAYDAVHEFVFDPEGEVRAQMARVLGRTGDPRAAPLLAALARDPEWFVRLRALAAMGALNRPACLDAVLAGARDLHFQVRARAAQTLARLAADPQAVLAALVKAGDRYGLEAYVSLLGRSGLLWRTLELLRAPDTQQRERAAAVLGAALEAGATQEFLYALETHPAPRVRVAVARLLAARGSAALLPELERLEASARTRRQQAILGWLRRQWAETMRRAAPTAVSDEMAARV